MCTFPTDDLINRRTEFRFSGCPIKLDLSLGLFSSAGVDTGSMLLLKTLAKEAGVGNPARILDVGCGTGTLGLALAARYPESEVVMVDRDALAVDFSRHNAALNRLKNISVHCRLMTEGPHEAPYDLVMSNFPAKAGESVLADYLDRSMSLLAPGGRAALVIVHTLADDCQRLIVETGGEVLAKDASKQHTVYHYRRKGGGKPDTAGAGELSLDRYIRHHGEFKLKRTRYELDTVWNIGDFDTLSWRLKLMGDILDALPPVKGNIGFWAPGQGHMPLAVAGRRGSRPESILLAGRDRLALAISTRNLEQALPDIAVEPLFLGDPGRLADESGSGSLDFLLTDLSPVPRSDWTGPLKDAAAARVTPGGLWAVLGRSSDMADLMKYSSGWTPAADRRNRGWRAVLLQRNS